MRKSCRCRPSALTIYSAFLSRLSDRTLKRSLTLVKFSRTFAKLQKPLQVEWSSGKSTKGAYHSIILLFATNLGATVTMKNGISRAILLH